MLCSLCYHVSVCPRGGRPGPLHAGPVVSALSARTKPSKQSLARLLQQPCQHIVTMCVAVNIVTRKVSKWGWKLVECHRNPLVLGHSLETNSQSAIQIPYRLCNSNTQFCVHKNVTLITVLYPFNSLHNVTVCFFNTLRTELLNCLNARSRGLNFRHRASCI